jgi:hypothetical protein
MKTFKWILQALFIVFILNINIAYSQIGFSTRIDSLINLVTTTPVIYSLSQNYPNPFNPSTKIDYSLLKQSFVSIKIFDVLGREVKTLINEFKNTGYYSIEFNASELSSGV